MRRRNRRRARGVAAAIGLVAGGGYAGEGAEPAEPVTHTLSRLVEIELRALAARPGVRALAGSVAEKAAVKEGLRRMLAFAGAEPALLNRLFDGQAIDLARDADHLGAGLRRRAAALGPGVLTRYEGWVRSAGETFGATRAPLALGPLAVTLRSRLPAYSLPRGFDLTRGPGDVAVPLGYLQKHWPVR